MRLLRRGAAAVIMVSEGRALLPESLRPRVTGITSERGGSCRKAAASRAVVCVMLGSPTSGQRSGGEGRVPENFAAGGSEGLSNSISLTATALAGLLAISGRGRRRQQVPLASTSCETTAEGRGH